MYQIAIGLSTILCSVLLLIPYNLPELFTHMDKVGHVLFFALFPYAFSFFLSLRKAVLLAFAIGIVVECCQHFMESRTGSIDDIVANTAGVLLMWLILSLVNYYKR